MLFVVLLLLPLLLRTSADVQQRHANATEKQLGSGFDCGAVLRGAEFRLVSPGYPLPAPRGVTCFYVIEAAHPSICFIELTFLTFDLGDCDTSGNSLEVAGQVLCGGTTAGTRSFRFNPPRSLVVFRSGETAAGRGFELLVRQQQCQVPEPTAQPDCSTTYTAPQFYIQSPSRRPTGRVCEYQILGSNRPLALCQVELLFENFDLEATAGCTGERLEVGDQDVLCGILTGTRLYRFVGLLRLRYVSTRESIGSGFRILVVQKGCRQLVFSSSGGGLTPSVPVPTPPPFQPDLGPHPPLDPNIPLCCGVVYGSRHFYLASPGFPYYNGNALRECVYRIRSWGPDVCRIRVIFRFFWLGKEDSYIGCLNNGYLQLDDGQRICGCKTGLVLVLPFFQGQEKTIYYRGYSGGGFILEVFQESCSDPGWFEAAVPHMEEFYPFSVPKERQFLNVTTSNTSETNTTDKELLSSGSTRMSSDDQSNILGFPEGEEQLGNFSHIENALNKNCKVSWNISVNQKQVLLCSNKSNEPSSTQVLRNESHFPSEKLPEFTQKDVSLSPLEVGLCNFRNNLSSANTSQDCGSLDKEDSRRYRRDVHEGGCYNWYSMVQEARRFLWVNGLPRTLCPGSRRCHFLGEIAGWIKIPGYPPTYPNNVHRCFG